MNDKTFEITYANGSTKRVVGDSFSLDRKGQYWGFWERLEDGKQYRFATAPANQVLFIEEVAE